MRNLLIVLSLTAQVAQAQTPLSTTAFEAYVAGKTIIYGDRTGHYGGEQYLDGRRVVWSTQNGECVKGVWYGKGDQICFDYEATDTPQCWNFYREGHGLWARYVSDISATVVFERSASKEPLYCVGPKVGS